MHVEPFLDTYRQVYELLRDSSIKTFPNCYAIRSNKGEEVYSRPFLLFLLPNVTKEFKTSLKYDDYPVELIIS